MYFYPGCTANPYGIAVDPTSTDSFTPVSVGEAAVKPSLYAVQECPGYCTAAKAPNLICLRSSTADQSRLRDSARFCTGCI